MGNAIEEPSGQTGRFLDFLNLGFSRLGFLLARSFAPPLTENLNNPAPSISCVIQSIRTVPHNNYP
jgi:hypothetical protein